MKIYMASKYGRLKELAEYRLRAEERGIEITSTWLEGKEEGLTGEDIANLDLGDIDRADAIMLFTQPVGSANVSGNRFIEFGYAWARGKKLIVVGPLETAFMQHRSIQNFGSFEDFMAYATGEEA